MPQTRTPKTSILLVTLFCFAALAVVSHPAHALDKRLKLLFKTSGYGAAGGAVIGAGTWALGLGGPKNILMGASCGLYAGMLLAGYIMISPNEDDADAPRDQYHPRKPVSPDEWEKGDNDEEDLRKHHLRKMKDDNGMLLGPGLNPVAVGSGRLEGRQREVALWTPLLSVSF